MRTSRGVRPRASSRLDRSGARVRIARVALAGIQPAPRRAAIEPGEMPGRAAWPSTEQRRVAFLLHQDTMAKRQTRRSVSVSAGLVRRLKDGGYNMSSLVEDLVNTGIDAVERGELDVSNLRMVPRPKPRAVAPIDDVLETWPVIAAAVERTDRWCRYMAARAVNPMPVLRLGRIVRIHRDALTAWLRSMEVALG